MYGQQGGAQPGGEPGAAAGGGDVVDAEIVDEGNAS
jgi:hypothetical protein